MRISGLRVLILNPLGQGWARAERWYCYGVLEARTPLSPAAPTLSPGRAPKPRWPSPPPWGAAPGSPPALGALLLSPPASRAPAPPPAAHWLAGPPGRLRPHTHSAELARLRRCCPSAGSETWLPGGRNMLDFAIFAVTFLLALVAAVLYLYPVTAVSASGALTAAPAFVFPASTSLCTQWAAGGGPEGRVPALAPAPAPRGAAPEQVTLRARARAALGG